MTMASATAISSATSPVPVSPSKGVLRPLGLDEVRITGGFWGTRQDINGSRTLTHIERWLENEGWIDNFDRAAAGLLPGGRRGREFSDSEVYKYLEALAWEIARRRDDGDLDRRLRAIVDRVAAAQEADGYLNTNFGRPGQQPRWSDLEWGHELYCLGHLFQAAVARVRTAPEADDGLVPLARRAADLVCEVFGASGIQSVCGHAEIEVGLAELGRALGEHSYIEQAARFVERRGHGTLGTIEWGQEYFQDDMPVREAIVLRGHAVRANYLAAGAVDVAVETDDAELLDALREQWQHTVERRTYLTGGQGSHHQDEAFGEDFELPADRAYSETCAGISSIMFSWRLLLAQGNPEYADLIERTLFNVVATSPAASGEAFFYANTLHQRRAAVSHHGEQISPGAQSSLRAPWFAVACCPPNLARTYASLAAYIATTTDDGLQIHQYAPVSIRTTLASGERVELDIETTYPQHGEIRLRILTDAVQPWSLSLRVPAWAVGARVDVVSGTDTDTLNAEPGVAVLTRRFRAGDQVTLHVPLHPRFTRPDPRIDAVRGCLAVERGPEVYCLESIDVDPASDTIDHEYLDPAIAPVEHDGSVEAVFSRALLDHAPWPYAPTGTITARGSQGRALRLIPYHSWGERGPAAMRVWLPTRGSGTAAPT